MTIHQQNKLHASKIRHNLNISIQIFCIAFHFCDILILFEVLAVLILQQLVYLSEWMMKKHVWESVLFYDCNITCISITTDIKFAGGIRCWILLHNHIEIDDDHRLRVFKPLAETLKRNLHNKLITTNLIEVFVFPKFTHSLQSSIESLNEGEIMSVGNSNKTKTMLICMLLSY